MNTFHFKIAKDDMSGLCNQLYSLSGCIEYCVEKGIENILIGKFLKEIKTDKKCPISEVLDLITFNEYLEKFSIKLKDGYDLYEKNEKIFKPSPIPYMGQSKNPRFFLEILSNIPFLEKYDTISKNYIKYDNLNVIHLRLENDALLCFSKEMSINSCVYKAVNEYRYIECIKKYIDKDTMTFVLTSDEEEDNKVIKFLKENNYKFEITKKIFEDREMNAIIDLLLGFKCNKTFIGSYDSSFSYSIMCRLINSSSYLIECNNYINRYRLYNRYTRDLYEKNPSVPSMVFFENIIL